MTMDEGTEGKAILKTEGEDCGEGDMVREREREKRKERERRERKERERGR